MKLKLHQKEIIAASSVAIALMVIVIALSISIRENDVVVIPITEGIPDVPAAEETGPKMYTFLEVVDSCGAEYEGVCVNVRSGPGVSFPSVLKLRTGIVLRVEKAVEADGREWLKIAQDNVRYPERITDDWYVAADVVEVFTDIGVQNLKKGDKSKKTIIVDRSDQKLYAYDGEDKFMEAAISTGHELTPTPRGNFTVYMKTPGRYMQGPLPGISDQFYDLPGVPWNLYFTKQGAVIHGAYWHNNFGMQWSHGCVNLPPATAKELYQWADLGTVVTVRD